MPNCDPKCRMPCDSNHTVPARFLVPAHQGPDTRVPCPIYAEALRKEEAKQKELQAKLTAEDKDFLSDVVSLMGVSKPQREYGDQQLAALSSKLGITSDRLARFLCEHYKDLQAFMGWVNSDEYLNERCCPVRSTEVVTPSGIIAKLRVRRNENWKYEATGTELREGARNTGYEEVRHVEA